MQNCLVAKNVANLLAHPDPSAEVVSQAIMGAPVSVEKTENNYCYGNTPDGYHGWISQLRLVEVWDSSKFHLATVKKLFADLLAEPSQEAELLTRAVISTRLAVIHDSEESEFLGVLLPDKRTAYISKLSVEEIYSSVLDGQFFEERWRKSLESERLHLVNELGRQAVLTAKKLIGTPYLWGGCTPYGIDCSGLIQLCFKINGLNLLRDSYMQYDDKRFEKIEVGKKLDSAQFRAGDIVVFDTMNKGRVTHIGIAMGNGNFIHASGERVNFGVQIQPCSTPFYRDAYLGAVRLSTKADLALSAA